jgi:hypothetical protein
MAIQISGTTVIDNSRNLTNTVNISASGTIAGDIIATKAVAEAGTDNTKLMTPLRVKEAIDALGGNVINRIQRGSTAYSGNSVTAPITAVDLGKSFISQGDRQDVFGGVGYGFPSPGLAAFAVAIGGGGAGRLTSTTVVTVTAAAPITLPQNFAPNGISIGILNTGTVDWEVIEFK